MIIDSWEVLMKMLPSENLLSSPVVSVGSLEGGMPAEASDEAMTSLTVLLGAGQGHAAAECLAGGRSRPRCH